MVTRYEHAVDDNEAEVARFRVHGIVMRNELMDFHSRKLIFLKGPEGITVELSELGKRLEAVANVTGRSQSVRSP